MIPAHGAGERSKIKMAKRNYNQLGKAQSTAIRESIDKSEIRESVKPAQQGIVGNCSKLNIRSEPSKDARVVGIIDVGAKVFVYPDESTGDWYRVRVGKELKGFCMKAYITVMEQ